MGLIYLEFSIAVSGQNCKAIFPDRMKYGSGADAALHGARPGQFCLDVCLSQRNRGSRAAPMMPASLPSWARVRMVRRLLSRA